MAEVRVAQEELVAASQVLRELAQEVAVLREATVRTPVPDTGSDVVAGAVVALLSRWQEGLAQLAAESLELADGLERAGQRYADTEAAVTAAASP